LQDLRGDFAQSPENLRRSFCVMAILHVHPTADELTVEAIVDLDIQYDPDWALIACATYLKAKIPVLGREVVVSMFHQSLFNRFVRHFRVSNFDWYHDLTREGIEPNPGYDRQTSNSAGSSCIEPPIESGPQQSSPPMHFNRRPGGRAPFPKGSKGRPAEWRVVPKQPTRASKNTKAVHSSLEESASKLLGEMDALKEMAAAEKEDKFNPKELEVFVRELPKTFNQVVLGGISNVGVTYENVEFHKPKVYAELLSGGIFALLGLRTSRIASALGFIGGMLLPEMINHGAKLVRRSLLKYLDKPLVPMSNFESHDVASSRSYRMPWLCKLACFGIKASNYICSWFGGDSITSIMRVNRTFQTSGKDVRHSSSDSIRVDEKPVDWAVAQVIEFNLCTMNRIYFQPQMAQELAASSVLLSREALQRKSLGNSQLNMDPHRRLLMATDTVLAAEIYSSASKNMINNVHLNGVAGQADIWLRTGIACVSCLTLLTLLTFRISMLPGTLIRGAESLCNTLLDLCFNHLPPQWLIHHMRRLHL